MPEPTSLIHKLFNRIRSSTLYLALLIFLAALSIYIRALLAESRQQGVYEGNDLLTLLLMTDLHINTLARYFYVWLIAVAIVVLLHALKR